MPKRIVQKAFLISVNVVFKGEMTVPNYHLTILGMVIAAL